MPLTPEDVSNKRFTPVRLREGYDMGEVDQFLDEVEAELDRLIAESNDLRAKLDAATGGTSSAAATPVVSPVADRPDAAEADDDEAGTPGETGDKPAVTGSVAAAAPRETIQVVTAAEASSAALRLLELATKNADEVVAEAKQEAEEIVGSARTEAERLQSETKARTDALEEEARSRAQNLDAETDARRSQLLGDVETEKARLEGEVETLRAFEREYRSRLKSYFTEQLQALDGVGEAGEPLGTEGSGNPTRLRSLLGGDGAPAEAGADSDPDSAATAEGPVDGESPKA
jgi:DivIVA domain-containing protein